MVKEFVTTVYRMALAGQWAEIREYFALIRELIATPQLELVPGKPQDKPQ